MKKSFLGIFLFFFGIFLFSSVPAFASSSWTTTGSMLQEPRSSFTAITLLNGKVLIAGGRNASGAVSDSELYDPATGTWSATGNLTSPREGPIMKLLPDGTVLAAAGYLLNNAETYDPATGVWTPTANSMNAFYGSSTATLLPNGKVFIAGGHDSGTSTTLYDPVTRTFSDGPSLSTMRELPTAALLPNGKVLIAGGDDPFANLVFSSAEIYDPATNTFSPAASMNVPRIAAASILLPDGKVLVVGGYGAPGQTATAELYDPITNTWTLTGSMLTNEMGGVRDGHGIHLLPNGHVLVDLNLHASEEYDPSTGLWGSSVDLVQQQLDGADALLLDGRVLVVGGFIGDFRTTAAQIYTPDVVVTPTPTPTPTQLSALSPAKIWVGLKTSDDAGVKFDLKAEVYKDTTLVSSGELDSVAAGSSGFNNAKLDTINFNSFSPIDFPSGSVLSIKLYVRNACSGSGHNSGVARLWYNDSAANSQFDATIGDVDTNYYLLDNFLLGLSTGSTKKTVDVQSGTKCSVFKSFGTWTITP